MKAVVIGAGAAGTAAALALRGGGADVVVLDGAWGATHACSGAWDVATARSGDERWQTSTADRIGRLAEARPSHPYARMKDAVEAIERTHASVFEAIGGYRQLDLSSPGVRVATDHGVVVRAASIDEDLLSLDEAPGGLVAVASLRGHPTIDGGFVARGLSADPGAGDLSFVDVPIEYFSRRSDALMWPHEAAALGDAEDARARLCAVLERALPERRAHAWLLPPLLGLESSRAARLLTDAIGHPVGELASAGGGAQGTRLARRLAVARDAAGVEERRIRALRIEGAKVIVEGDEAIEADALILASGSAAAGGLAPDARGGLEEPLTRTPVALGAWGRLDARADAFTAGVSFGDDFRVLDDAGEAIGDALFACGGVLEGVSPADGTGLGAAVTTGWLAGESALAG